MTTTHNALAGDAEVVWPWVMSEIFLVLLPHLPLVKYTLHFFLSLFLPSVLTTDLSLPWFPYAPQANVPKMDSMD